MRRITTPDGTVVSYDRYGTGAPLVLVHGGFSDHETNWEFVKPTFEKRFAVHAVARRGRGEYPYDPPRKADHSPRATDLSETRNSARRQETAGRCQNLSRRDGCASGATGGTRGVGCAHGPAAKRWRRSRL